MNTFDHNRQKKIAVINDFSGFGRCSIAVSLPIISAMGIQCCPLPTAIFSNHTGFSSFYRVDFTEHMTRYSAEWEKLGLRFSGILTGFLGSEQQIEIVGDFLQDFTANGIIPGTAEPDDSVPEAEAANGSSLCTAEPDDSVPKADTANDIGLATAEPDDSVPGPDTANGSRTLVVIDPVMGDYGKLYPGFSEKLAMKMHRLIPFADILTPNLTEACILTRTQYREDMTTDELHRLCDELAAHCDPDKNIKIVISGLNRDRYLENFVYERGMEPQMVMTPKIGSNRSGTGDVFSSIIAGCAVRGMEFRESVWTASEFIGRCLKTTMEMELPLTDGIAFEEHLFELR